MAAHIQTLAFRGIDVAAVDVQVQLSGGLPAFTLVGLPDKAVAESKERVRAALSAIGLALPPKRITVNLAPADMLKEGSHFDLPIALGLLVAMELIAQDEIDGYLALGELGLDGSLAPVSGILAAARFGAERELGLICPHVQGGEAAWASPPSVLAPAHLLDLIGHFKGETALTAPEPELAEADFRASDFAHIKGQTSAKRVMEIAAAGGHNVLMIGPPGAGKSMLAAALPSILPPLSPAEALEVSTIHSIAGQLDGGRLLRQRPFRDPHHSASLPALTGGGLRAKPGEISLAHRGVLFLDELPEFERRTLEALRQPLETGSVSLARANAHVTYPARFQLIGAMNPCRCGYLGDPDMACNKAPACGQDYQNRLSGPLLDRIDLVIEMASLSPLELAKEASGEASSVILQRVEAARARQADRLAALEAPAGLRCNAELSGDLLERAAPLDGEARALMEQAVEQLRLSARGFYRVIKVARSIADLAGEEAITSLHLSEALQYRRRALPQPKRTRFGG